MSEKKTLTLTPEDLSAIDDNTDITIVGKLTYDKDNNKLSMTGDPVIKIGNTEKKISSENTPTNNNGDGDNPDFGTGIQDIENNVVSNIIKSEIEEENNKSSTSNTVSPKQLENIENADNNNTPTPPSTQQLTITNWLGNKITNEEKKTNAINEIIEALKNISENGITIKGDNDEDITVSKEDLESFNTIAGGMRKSRGKVTAGRRATKKLPKKRVTRRRRVGGRRRKTSKK